MVAANIPARVIIAVLLVFLWLQLQNDFKKCHLTFNIIAAD